jgi:serine/threonine-protein kinase HipA
VFSKPHHAAAEAHYDGNYDGIGKFILARCGAEDFDEFLRRLVFSTIAGNSDAHLKNWSVQYLDGIRPRLSPAYDLLFVGAYEGYGGERLALKIAGEDRFDGLNSAHFEQLAKHAIKRAPFVAYDLERAKRVVRAAAEQTREAWRALPDKDRLPTKIRVQLEAHQARIKLP